MNHDNIDQSFNEGYQQGLKEAAEIVYHSLIFHQYTPQQIREQLLKLASEIKEND